LFGKNTKYIFPGAYIQHVLFVGLDNATDILNQNEFSGNLVSMPPRLEAFVEMSVIQNRPLPVSMRKHPIKDVY
jgi:predicted HTH transcriptional regulator